MVGVNGVGTDIRSVSVIIPAKDEQVLLPRCLRAVERACVEAQHVVTGLDARIVVVLDSCIDASELVVRHRARTMRARSGIDVSAVLTDVGSVGGARALGADHALAASRAGTIEPRHLWLASTDADTLVPPHWLSSQLRFAANGIDVVLGTVEPDLDLAPAERARWMARHQLLEGHPHVHGANLGVRASAYAQVGGFAALAAHEDVDLVSRLRAHAGILVRATDRHRVVTSSRYEGRAVGGFATYLSDIRETTT